MMVIQFCRAMRRRGYRYSRARRGVMRFSGRFPNGFGITTLIPVHAVALSNLDPRLLADFVFRKDTLSAGCVIRTADNG